MNVPICCSSADQYKSVCLDCLSFLSTKVWDLHDHTCLLTVRPKAHKIRGDLAGELGTGPKNKNYTSVEKWPEVRNTSDNKW